MAQNPFSFRGLNEQEVESSRNLYGTNTTLQADRSVWLALKESVTEPMFLLLVLASTLYFILGEYAEAIFMIAAIFLVSAISFYQDTRSRKALAALRAFTEVQATVIRDDELTQIPSAQIVIDDLVVVDEGKLVPADGIIIQSNDFAVNESILTGEAFSIFKNKEPGNHEVFQGTQVVSGLAVFKVTRIGGSTSINKVGKLIEDTADEATPLQNQIKGFVRKMAIGGIAVFVMIWIVNFSTSGNILDSLLKALTLAMSVLPEEIPVAFTTFMALGTSRLMKSGIIVKNIRTVETLGSATVICIDKTGTITENRMELERLYIWPADKYLNRDEWNTEEGKKIIRVAMWASEPVPFDPMEKSLHAAYAASAEHDERSDYKMIHEYPLSGKPPMMTHVFENHAHHRIIACKGSPENLLAHSTVSSDTGKAILARVSELSDQGFRVLGVGTSSYLQKDLPSTQEEFVFEFLGLVAFFDPPKKNIADTFNAFYDAGIQVKMITGDMSATALAIARQTGLKNATDAVTGSELLIMSESELEATVKQKNIFTRMYPEAKVRIVKSLKKLNHVVAMTGDGVNDGPALKASHIGIAMGKRGSELAKQAAALILTDDDLSKMIDAIAMGRKIYSNLKKAIQYIISIHIPIILTVALPLFLNWIYPAIFTPVHVIFLELIMGPTCSIVYENEPLEATSMQEPPRRLTDTFLSWRELSLSVLQGLTITAGTLIIYQVAAKSNMIEDEVRTMVFSTLVFANIFLTLVNRSFYFSVTKVLRYKNRLLGGIIFSTILLLLLMVYVPLIRNFFQLSSLTVDRLIWCLLTGCLSVIWIEVYKWYKRRKTKTHFDKLANR
jgi:Ca2+-transporting ATPase